MTLPRYLLLPYTYSLMLNHMELLAITRTLIRIIETLPRPLKAAQQQQRRKESYSSVFCSDNSASGSHDISTHSIPFAFPTQT